MMAWKALGLGGSVVLAIYLFGACGGSSAETSGTDSSGAGASTSSSGNAVASSSSSTVGASSGSGGGGPVMCTDQYSSIPIGECDLLQQNCPAGFACRPSQAGMTYTTKCVAASGLKGQATACANADECEAGLFCVFGKCTPVCCSSDPMACGGGTCNVDVNIGSFFMRVCAFPQSCTLFMPGSCTPPEECHLSDTTQGLAVCVAPSGPNQVDEGIACMYLNDCKEAQMCYPAGMNMFFCRYNCDLMNWQTLQPGLGGCPAGRTCQNKNFMPPNIGICLP